MNYETLIADELARSGLDSVFGLAVREADADRVTLSAHDARWVVSGPALLGLWRGTRSGWALNARVSWAMILSDLDKAKVTP